MLPPRPSSPRTGCAATSECGEIPLVGGDFLGHLHHRAGTADHGWPGSRPARTQLRATRGAESTAWASSSASRSAAGHPVGAHRVHPVPGVADQRPAGAVRRSQVAGRQCPDVPHGLRPGGRADPCADPGRVGQQLERGQRRTAPDQLVDPGGLARRRTRRSGRRWWVSHRRSSRAVEPFVAVGGKVRPVAVQETARRAGRACRSRRRCPGDQGIPAVGADRPAAPVRPAATRGRRRPTIVDHHPGHPPVAVACRPATVAPNSTVAPARCAASTSSASITVRRGAYSASTPADGLMDTATDSAP